MKGEDFARLRLVKYLWRVVWARTAADPRVVDQFLRMWFSSPDTWAQNTWFGHAIMQCPFDIHLYQQIMHATKPSYVVQTGVCDGGSLLFFAHMFDLQQAPPSAVVVGVDIGLSAAARAVEHPRVIMIEGDSIAAETLRRVESHLPDSRGLVSLDSNHSMAHVLEELRLYQRFVGPGCYLVAEDTIINGHPVWPGVGPGPYEAVEQFLKETDCFARDDDLWRRNLFSFHQYGWLKRVR